VTTAVETDRSNSIYDTIRTHLPEDPTMDAMLAADESQVLRLRDANPELLPRPKRSWLPYDDFTRHGVAIDKRRPLKPRRNVYWTAFWTDEYRECLQSRDWRRTSIRSAFIGCFSSIPFCFLRQPRTDPKTATWCLRSVAEKMLRLYEQKVLTSCPRSAGYEAFVRQTLADNQRRAAWL